MAMMCSEGVGGLTMILFTSEKCKKESEGSRQQQAQLVLLVVPLPRHLHSSHTGKSCCCCGSSSSSSAASFWRGKGCISHINTPKALITAA